MLLVEPYKGEILPHWRFKTVAKAKKSSAKICRMFLVHLKAVNFPGTDMAREFLRPERDATRTTKAEESTTRRPARNCQAPKIRRRRKKPHQEKYEGG